MLRHGAALLAVAGLATHGIRKKSLSVSGAAAASALGLAIFSHPSPLFGAVLLTFYLSSSKLTKYKVDVKKRLEEGHLEGGQRNAVQVLSNGLTGAVTCVVHGSLVAGLGSDPSWTRAALYAYLGHFACCNADTWASELGVLSASDPILITTLRRVPKGTNGGVSVVGTAASIAGGMAIGVVATLVSAAESYVAAGTVSLPWDLLLVCTAAGAAGSLLDSLMGATLQRSVYNKHTKQIAQDHRTLHKGESASDLLHVSGLEVLDNHQVNFLSSLLMAAAAGAVGFAGWLA
ncbi:integral membrane protein DUF92-domain-containing protein [Entophlyctis helioformis]|nr:integral membrane protein DUF92-domain-containing protein [Entophlyctis helioformis]